MEGFLNSSTGHWPKGPKCKEGPLACTCKMPPELTRTDQKILKDPQKMQRNCKGGCISVPRGTLSDNLPLVKVNGLQTSLMLLITPVLLPALACQNVCCEKRPISNKGKKQQPRKLLKIEQQPSSLPANHSSEQHRFSEGLEQQVARFKGEMAARL